LNDLSFTLLNKAVHNSASGDTRLSDRFAAGYSWYGREVTVRLLAWDAPLATTRYAAIWKGYLTECRYDDEVMEFSAVAGPMWKLAELFRPMSLTR